MERLYKSLALVLAAGSRQAWTSRDTAWGDVHGVVASRDGANTGAQVGKLLLPSLGVETPPKTSWASLGSTMVKTMLGCNPHRPVGAEVPMEVWVMGKQPW